MPKFGGRKCGGQITRELDVFGRKSGVNQAKASYGSCSLPKAPDCEHFWQTRADDFVPGGCWSSEEGFDRNGEQFPTCASAQCRGEALPSLSPSRGSGRQVRKPCEGVPFSSLHELTYRSLMPFLNPCCIRYSWLCMKQFVHLRPAWTHWPTFNCLVCANWFGHTYETETVKIFSGFETRIKSSLGCRIVLPLFMPDWGRNAVCEVCGNPCFAISAHLLPHLISLCLWNCMLKALWNLWCIRYWVLCMKEFFHWKPATAYTHWTTFNFSMYELV